MTKDVAKRSRFSLSNMVDLDKTDVRELNKRLHQGIGDAEKTHLQIVHPRGKHALAVGLSKPLKVTIDGHVGYYCGGMNQQADITITGNAGPGLAENIMSGVIRVEGNASQSAAASGHGGLVMINGNASARCGISMKGVDIVVGGSVGHLSGFMAQNGRLVVCGDAGNHLGDSIYEASIYVQGKVAGLGADCIEKEMTQDHIKSLQALLDKMRVITSAGSMQADARKFRRYGSERKLYHFHVDHAHAY